MTDGTRAVESLEIGPETRDRVAEIARRPLERPGNAVNLRGNRKG